MNSALYFDAHCHLAASAASDCTRMVCCGTSPDDWDRLRLGLAGCPGSIPAYGVHPWFVPETGEADSAVSDALNALLLADARAAVGEVGLDFARRDGASRVRQRDVLMRQLQLARRHERVAVIHCVRAWGALLETLEAAPPLPRGFVLHAFGGSAELVVPLARLGAYFSFKAGDEPLSRRAAARMQAVPGDRLLLESDLFPGRDGADAALQLQRLDAVAVQLAAATGMTREQVARLTADNAHRCFGG